MDQRLEVNSLETGAVSERVEVAAQADHTGIVMPLKGRYFGDLALLSDGAVQSAPGSPFAGAANFGTISRAGKAHAGSKRSFIAVALAGQAWLHSVEALTGGGAEERSMGSKPCRRQ